MKILLLVILISFSLTSTILSQHQGVDSLLHILKEQTGKARAKTLIELCWEYRFSNADTARVFGVEGLELARKLKLTSLEADALNFIGVTHEAQGNYTEALDFELKALAIRRNLGDDVRTANTLNNIGIVYDEQGNYQKSLEYYFEARKIYERLQDLPKIGMVINNIGIVLKAQKEYMRVIGYYHEALVIYQKLNNKFGVAACHTNLGSVFLLTKGFDSALYYSQRAAIEFEAINNRQFLATALYNTGMAFHKLQNQQEAIKNLLKAKKLCEEFDNKRELSSILIYLAGIDREAGKIKDGISTAQHGLEIAIRISSHEQIMEARKELANLYSVNKNFEEALKQYRQYDVAKDSLFEINKSKQITEIQTRYETEKNENKILLLGQENKLKDSNIRQNQLLIVSLVGILLGGVALGFLYRTRSKLTQQAELESTRASLRESQLQAVIASQEEERKRFAADLHDGLGQMISAVRMGLSKETLEKSMVDHSLSLLNDMNIEIRNIAFNLMPQVLVNSGLEEALKEFASRLMRTVGINIQVQTFDLDRKMPSELRVALYRISQEWVNNIIKYSSATETSIQVVKHPQELLLTIEDNGKGFNPSKLTQSQGNGWKNINSRLHLIKGHLEIDSQEGRQNTTLIITIPQVI